jgi:uncharacterized RmlC-like cupin family protein
VTSDRLHLIRADEASEDTAQTPGMRRLAGVSGATAGADGLFMGQTHLGPGVRSGAHHHGRSETAIFVVAGHPVFLFRDGDDIVRIETRPGDYIYVPPFVPHVDENPAPDTEAVVVLARTTQEAIVENLDTL